MGHCHHWSFPREWAHMEWAGGGRWLEPLRLMVMPQLVLEERIEL